MSTVFLILLKAISLTFVGYLMNNLVGIPIQNKGWLVFRLLVWITTIHTLVYDVLTDEVISADIKTWAKYGIAILTAALVLDLRNLLNAISREKSGPQDNANANLEPRLRIIALFRDEVEKRLEDSLLNREVSINLMMRQRSEQGGYRSNDKLIMLERIKVEHAESDIRPQEGLLDTLNRLGGRKLLILGIPGSGKTTTLLKVAEELLKEALEPDSRLIPVIFELSTWEDNNQSLDDWLIEQLSLKNKRPGVSKDWAVKVSEDWIKKEFLLPLLDGLDELEPNQQVKCIKRINEFFKKYNYPGCIVCCNQQEYEHACEQENVKLDLFQKIVLQPLTNQQISTYFEKLQREDIWQAIQTQQELQALLADDKSGSPGILRVPLFLNFLAVTYRPNVRIHGKKELLEAYISECQERIQRERIYDINNVNTYLHWLAKKMEIEGISEFDVDYVRSIFLFRIENKIPHGMLTQKQDKKLSEVRIWMIDWLGDPLDSKYKREYRILICLLCVMSLLCLRILFPDFVGMFTTSVLFSTFGAIFGLIPVLLIAFAFHLISSRVIPALNSRIKIFSRLSKILSKLFSRSFEDVIKELRLHQDYYSSRELSMTEKLNLRFRNYFKFFLYLLKGTLSLFFSYHLSIASLKLVESYISELFFNGKGIYYEIAASSFLGGFILLTSGGIMAVIFEGTDFESIRGQMHSSEFTGSQNNLSIIIKFLQFPLIIVGVFYKAGNQVVDNGVSIGT